MEETEKGIISEEALEEVAGGLSIDKEKLKKSLEIAGVAVVSAAALTGAGFGIYKLGEKKGNKEGFFKGYDEGKQEGIEVGNDLNFSRSIYHF